MLSAASDHVNNNKCDSARELEGSADTKPRCYLWEANHMTWSVTYFEMNEPIIIIFIVRVPAWLLLLYNINH